jgi:putative DNA primase/helicase
VFEARRHADELRTMREMVEAGTQKLHELGHIARKSGKAKLTLVQPRDSERPAVDGANALELLEEEEEVPYGAPSGLLLEGTNDKGRSPMTTRNLRALLKFYGIKIAWNEMTKEQEVEIPVAVMDTERLRINARVGRIRELAKRHGMNTGESFQDAYQAILDENAYHPARDWVLGVKWDGVSRFNALWKTLVIRQEKEAFLGLYHEQLYRWCIGAAKLAIVPKLAGREHAVAAQGVLVLQGPQGRGKTEWFKGLAPRGMVGVGVTVDPSNKDDVVKATRTWLTELGEIDSTVRKADVGHLKAFLTNDVDTYRRPYAEHTEDFIRQTAFGASVNPEAFLRDTTGNRRFWVLPVERCKAFADEEEGLPHIDMQQFWAEMVELAQKGERHYLADFYANMQSGAAEEHRQRDPLEDEIETAFVVDPLMVRDYWLTTTEIYQALQPDRPLDRWTGLEKRAIGNVFAALGARKYVSNKGVKWSVRRRSG